MRFAALRGRARPAALGLIFVGGAALLSPAFAQMGDPASGNFQGFTGAPQIGGSQPRVNPVFGKPVPPPPAALPGAEPQSGAAAPASPGTIQDPNEALFDAINRGDVAAARDAINRGADVNGQNELGLTPIQVALDLGRNDVTFLLLANGAGKATGGPPGAPVGNGAKVAASAPVKPVKVARRKGEARTERVAVSATQVQQLPQLYAGNGGTPIPSAGFLGFNPGR